MRPVIRVAAAAVLAASVAACAADPYYARNNYNYGYSTAPGYAYSAPAYYRSPAYHQTTTYSYSSPQRNGYSSYWDYQRNYRGIHPGPEM